MCQLGMKAAEMIEMYITNITDTILSGAKNTVCQTELYFSRPYRKFTRRIRYAVYAGWKNGCASCPCVCQKADRNTGV